MPLLLENLVDEDVQIFKRIVDRLQAKKNTLEQIADYLEIWNDCNSALSSALDC